MRRLGDCCGVAQPRQARLHSSRKLNVGQSRLLGWSGSMLLRLEQALRDASAHILTRVQGWERPRQAPHSIHTACTSAGAVRGRDSASATSPPPPQPTSRLSRDVCSDGCRRHRAPACARLRSPLQACQPMGAGCALRRRPRQPARAEAALSQCAWLPCSQPGTCGSLAVLLVRIRALCVPSHGLAHFSPTNMQAWPVSRHMCGPGTDQVAVARVQLLRALQARMVVRGRLVPPPRWRGERSCLGGQVPSCTAAFKGMAQHAQPRTLRQPVYGCACTRAHRL